MRAVFLASAVLTVAGFASAPGCQPMSDYNPYDLILDSAPTFTLTSETVEDGGELPEAQWSGRFGVEGGEDASPQLSWEGAAADTLSYVVTCFDPDAPTISGFWHWAMYDIPANVTSLPLNAGNGTYSGMCVDADPPPHN